MNELFIVMEEESNNEFPEVEEIFVSQIDDEGNRIQSEVQNENTNVINKTNSMTLEEQSKTIQPNGEWRIINNEERFIPMDEIQLELEKQDESIELDERSDSEGDDTQKKFDYKKVFDEFTPERSNFIQDQNTLIQFLNRYDNILDNPDFKTLEYILLRIFYERLMTIYHFDVSYNIIYPQKVFTRDTVDYLKENINNFIKKFRKALYKAYLEIANRIPEDLKTLMSDYKVEGNDNASERNFKTLEEHIRNNVYEMKSRMIQLPERFLTALFFRYMYGVCVLSQNFKESIDNILTDKLVPYITNEKYVNEILFMGYWKSVPDKVRAEPYKIKEVITTLLNSKEKMKEFARRTVIELIKGKKAASTIRQGNTLNSLSNASLRLIQAINLRNEGEFKKQYIENRGDGDGNATRYMNEVERFKYEESKPKKFSNMTYINIEDSLNMLADIIEREDENALYKLFDIQHVIDWDQKDKKGQRHFVRKPNKK